MNKISEKSFISFVSLLITSIAVAASILSLPSIISTRNTNDIQSIISATDKQSNCLYKNETVNCNILLVSSEDITLYVDIDDSRIIDNEGNLYHASSAKVGNDNKLSSHRIRFVEDVPIKISIKFNDIDQLGLKINLLELSALYYQNSPNRQNIRIQNIEISR